MKISVTHTFGLTVLKRCLRMYLLNCSFFTQIFSVAMELAYFHGSFKFFSWSQGSSNWNSLSSTKAKNGEFYAFGNFKKPFLCPQDMWWITWKSVTHESSLLIWRFGYILEANVCLKPRWGGRREVNRTNDSLMWYSLRLYLWKHSLHSYFNW